MARFETINELTLKVTFDTQEPIHTKAGAMIAFTGNIQFEKELIGPGNNVVGQVIGNLGRKFTGENMALMKAIPKSQGIGYFAFEAQHVVVIDLAPGQRVAVESENLLAFSNSCKYGVMFLPLGTISQKGLATSTVTGPGQVAILSDGNPIVLQGPCNVDPDAMVAFTGNQPSLGLDLSFKQLAAVVGINGNSGESYNMKFGSPDNIVIVQPNERESGINIGMDGGSNGRRATNQQSQSLSGAAGSIMGTMGGLFGG